MAVNIYWTDTRLAAQRPAARALLLPTPASQPAPEAMAVTRADIRHRDGLIPSWVVFTMIILATFALCITVTMRTHAEMRSAEQKLSQMTTEVQAINNTNNSLKREVQRLQTDPRAIEAAARARLNMVRANEIVVPVD